VLGGLDCQGSESCGSEGMGIAMKEECTISSNMCNVCVCDKVHGESCKHVQWSSLRSNSGTTV
jgi:hypothetical protein